MTAVKVGQRWHKSGWRDSQRVVATARGWVLFELGAVVSELVVAQECTIQPSREGEYVEGETVEIVYCLSRWEPATYLAKIGEWHLVTSGDDVPIPIKSDRIRRPLPATKWVVPTQADIDEKAAPIPCKVRSVRDRRLIDKFLVHVSLFLTEPFIVMGEGVFNFGYCLIEVPASDPRPGVEVEG